MDITRAATREEVSRLLGEAGITGRAAEAALGESGAYRHRLRAARAWRVALEESATMGPPSAAMAAMLLVLEACGTGGREEVQGLSTVRHTAFNGLGKGRRNASDGPAWTAAIVQAAKSVADSVGVADEAFVVHLRGHDEGYKVPFSVLIAHGWHPWAMTLAREGLRISLGMAGWLQLEIGIRLQPPAEWAAAVNHLTAEQASVLPATPAD